MFVAQIFNKINAFEKLVIYNFFSTGTNKKIMLLEENKRKNQLQIILYHVIGLDTSEF